MQGTKYNVPSTRYEVDSEARIETQETRLIALCYEIRLVYEFPLLHSSISVRGSILRKVSSIKYQVQSTLPAAGRQVPRFFRNRILVHIGIPTSSFFNPHSAFDIKKSSKYPACGRQASTKYKVPSTMYKVEIRDCTKYLILAT